jgi:hypothetical protein
VTSGRPALAASRHLLPAALAAVLLFAGCGGSETTVGAPVAARTATPAPTTGTPELGPYPTPALSSSVKRRLDAGGVAVIGLDERGGIAPGRLWLNREMQVMRLQWSGWGSPQATGRGRVRTLVCNPNCAQGRLEFAAGTVTLSDIRLCGSRRFYSTAKLETGGKTPATYLETPC